MTKHADRDAEPGTEPSKWVVFWAAWSRGWRRSWFLLDKITPQLIALCLVLGSYGAIASYFQGKANEKLQQRQDAAQAERIADNEARTRDNEALLACFDTSLTQLANGLPAVRVASARRNAALTNALIGDDTHLGLGRLLVRAQMGIKSDPKKDLAALIATFQEFQKADRHLIAVQKAHPYPPAPSKFCDLP